VNSGWGHGGRKKLFCAITAGSLSELSRQPPRSVNDREDVDLLFEDAVNNAVRMLENLADRVVLVLRNYGSQPRLIGQLGAPVEDPFEDALSVLWGMASNVAYIPSKGSGHFG
jgi:hypothetical protein